MWLVELIQADEEEKYHQGQVLLTIYYFGNPLDLSARFFSKFFLGLRHHFSVWPSLERKRRLMSDRRRSNAD